MKRLVAAALLVCTGTAYAQSYPIQITYDTTYDTVDGVALKMDVYEPYDTVGERPLVIALHGGCFDSGDKKYMHYLAEALAKSGMVVANVNYRLAPAAVYPAAHQDARAALRFMRYNALRFNIDQNRVAAIGNSAGATLAAAIGVEPAYDRAGNTDALSAPVNVVVENHGRMDLAHDQFANDLTRIDCAERYLGMTRETNPQAFFDASPLNRVNPASAKFIITHGMADQAVWPLHSQRMHQRLIENGRSSTLVYMEGIGHSLPWETFRLSRAMLKREFGMPHKIVEDTTSAMRIDAGSAAARTPVEGFLSDRFFNGGAAFLYDPIKYASPLPETQSVRYSGKSFRYEMPNSVTGFKKISMSFFEPYNVGVGYRLQDVRFQGVNAFNELDIVKITGKGGFAFRQDVYVSTKNSILNVDFVKRGTNKGAAAVGSVEVTPLSAYE